MEQEPNRDLSSNSVSKCTDSLTNKGSTLTVVSPVSPENESSVVKAATPSNAQKQLIKDHTDLETSPSNPKSSNAQHQGALPDQSEQSYSSSPPVNEGDSGIDPFSEGGEENGEPRGSEGSAGATDTGVSLPAAEASAASSKAEQQDKIKGEAFL